MSLYIHLVLLCFIEINTKHMKKNVSCCKEQHLLFDSSKFELRWELYSNCMLTKAKRMCPGH